MADVKSDGIADLRAQLWESGFRPIAICNWNDAGIPIAARGKRPLDSGWQIQARLDPPRAAVGAVSAEQLNTGILCDGLRAFDLDIDDPELAGQCRSIIFDLLGEAPARYRENSGRCLILYRAAAGEPEKRVLAGHLGKVEVLGRGQQFVAFGRHASGADLYWYPDPPGVESFDQLPAVTEGQVLECLAALAGLIEAVELMAQAPLPIPSSTPSNGAATPSAPTSKNWDIPDWDRDQAPERGAAKGPDQLQADDPLLLVSALQAIPNDAGRPPDWEAWNETGMALWAATGGSALGRAAWHSWSARHPAYDPAAADERWSHYFRSPPTRIGAGSLFHRAEEHRWTRPVERLLRGPTGAKGSLEAWPFMASELLNIPRREWVYGHFLLKRFLAVLGAPGGAGKTAYAYAIAVSVALGRPLADEKVHQPGNVWIYNLEDPRDELLRRLAALIQHHKINPNDLEGRLFMDSGRDKPLVIAEVTDKGVVVVCPVVEELKDELIRRNIKLLVVDPFVKSHRLEENRNDQIDFAASRWSEVAEQADCAILLLHHFRKGGTPQEAASFRGASALTDAARSAVGLATMTVEEADKLGVAPGDRRFLIRADNSKLNLAPPPEETVWLKLCSVELPNGEPLRDIDGDNVQAVERWHPPSPWDGLSMSMVVRILDRLRDGPGEAEQYTLSRAGKSNTRWAGHVVVEIGAVTEGQAGQIIRKWTEEDLLKATTYRSIKTRREMPGLSIDPDRLSKMRQQVSDFGDVGEES